MMTLTTLFDLLLSSSTEHGGQVSLFPEQQLQIVLLILNVQLSSL